MTGMVPIRVRARGCFALLCALISFYASYAPAQSSDANAAERYAEEGQRALVEGRYPEAEQAYEKLRQLEPGIAEIHANLGLIYFKEGKFEQAVPVLRQALKLKPGLTKTDSLLAMSLSELGRYHEALPGLEKGFRRSTDPETKRMCGLHLERTYTGLQQHSKAVETALELDRLYPDDPEVLYHSGRVYGSLAYLTMERLSKVAPDSSWRHQAMAEAYESQGNSIAIDEYREVLKLDPRRSGIHYRLGRALLARSQQTNSADDVAEALKEFQKELELDPSNANAAYEIGEAHRKAGQLDEAQKFFAMSLKYYPEFEEAHLGLAAVLTAEQKPQDALLHLQKAIAADAEDEVAWYRLAQVQKALGNEAEQQKALAEFRRLHHQVNQQKLIEKVFSPSEVTKQELDPNASQQTQP
jgi:tetratricopeptide (TPR) repeat protein